MYAWFGSTEQIATHTTLSRPWDEIFSARPLIWSISELELLEAVLPTLPLTRLFDDLRADDPRTYLDLRAYLQGIGWNGPSASQYYPKRAREILDRAGDFWERATGDNRAVEND